MIDIEKQIRYWKDGAEEDWELAQDLIKRGKTRHGLFFAHLALEKLPKAHVCKSTQNLAPRIHNLIRLAEFAKLNLDIIQNKTLAKMNEFNIEGRYPDLLLLPPTEKEAIKYLDQSEKVYQWLI